MAFSKLSSLLEFCLGRENHLGRAVDDTDYSTRTHLWHLPTILS